MAEREGGTLTPKIRRAILAGQRPLLVWPGKLPCPVQKGEQIGLIYLRSEAGPAPQVSITIVGLRRGKKGEHIAEYSIRDDRPLYLRSGSGYTRVRAESVDPEADVIEEKALLRFAMEGQQKTVRQAATRRRQSELSRQEQRLKEVRSRGMSGAEKLVEGRLGKLRESLDDAA